MSLGSSLTLWGFTFFLGKMSQTKASSTADILGLHDHKIPGSDFEIILTKLKLKILTKGYCIPRSCEW